MKRTPLVVWSVWFVLLAARLATADSLQPAVAVLPRAEVVAMMREARERGQLGVARKTRPVDARPARPGEVIVTFIAGEGVETRSKPASEGDWVVRNRCPATGDEQYLVKAASFAERYVLAPAEPDAGGWREATPRGKEMRFLRLPAERGAFRFEAPWGEPMVARPGDVLVQDPGDEQDVYRVAAASFDCTYEVVR